MWEADTFKLTMVTTLSQHLALLENKDQPRCVISRPPSQHVSATHPSRLGADRRSQRPLISNHRSSCRCRSRGSPQESPCIKSHSFKKDAEEFARAHDDSFKEFRRRRCEKEPLREVIHHVHPGTIGTKDKDATAGTAPQAMIEVL